MKSSSTGLVIAIDGPDGVGKTTQVQLLSSYLSRVGLLVHMTRSSGGTPIGEELRKASLSKYSRPALTDFYISLAMGTALAEDVQKRKKRGEAVLVDRSPLAIVAYNAYGSGLGDNLIAFEACETLCKGWGIDALIFLNAPQDVLNQRRQKRATTDYFEQKDQNYHKRVREGYEAGLDYLQKHKQTGLKFLSIDADQTIQAIHKAIIAALHARELL